MATANICTICYEPLRNKTAILTAACGHAFHFECIKKNTKLNNRYCPLCREPIECFSTELSTSIDAEDDDRWNCSACTFRNSRNVELCIICTQGVRPKELCTNSPVHNQNNESNKLKVKPQINLHSQTNTRLNKNDQWACPTCTYVNSSSSKQCVMCESEFHPHRNDNFNNPVVTTSVQKVLHLSSGVAVSQECTRIAEELRSNIAYRDLSLSNKKLTVSEMRMIAEGLKYNTTVTSLQISYAKLTDDHVQPIAEALKFNTTLTSLSLDGNVIGDAGGMAISDALITNTTLEHLTMYRNNLSSIVKTMIDETGKGNRLRKYWQACL